MAQHLLASKAPLKMSSFSSHSKQLAMYSPRAVRELGYRENLTTQPLMPITPKDTPFKLLAYPSTEPTGGMLEADLQAWHNLCSQPRKRRHRGFTAALPARAAATLITPDPETWPCCWSTPDFSTLYHHRRWA